MTPAILETTKALAGIANAERINDENKKSANELLSKLLKVIGEDVEQAYRASTGIITPLNTGIA